MNMHNVLSKELIGVLKRTSSDEFFESVITLDEDFLFKLNILSNLKTDENNRLNSFILLYSAYLELKKHINTHGCISSIVAKKWARNGYDTIFNSFTIFSGYSYNYYYDELLVLNLKEVKEHFNLIELVFSILVREYLNENVEYTFSEFCFLVFELHKVRYVLQKENQVLSLNTKVAKTYCPDSLMTLYQHNNIVVIDENLEEVSSKTTFQNFLKGDKNNREETWKLFEYDILKVYDKVGGYYE